MTQKATFLTLGLVVLVLFIGGVAWRMGKMTSSTAGTASQSAQLDAQNQKNLTAAEPSGVMVNSKRNPSLDEISAQMKADGSEDAQALTDEENGETQNAQASGDTMTNLGTSYDESQY